MKYPTVFLTAVCSLVFTGLALAGTTEDYTLTIGDGSGFVGGSATVTCTFDNDGDEVNGLQGGVCADSDDVSQEEGDVDAVEVADLDTTFTALNVFTEENGWNFGILMNVVTGAVIETDASLELYEANYSISEDADPGDDEIEVNLTWCTLGTPPVPTAVIVEGVAFTPVCIDGTITISATPPFGDYYLTSEDLGYDADTFEGEQSAEFSIEEDLSGGGDARDTDGFQLAIRYDDTYVTATGMAAIGELADMNDGTGPGFFGVNTVPGNGPGITLGVVFNLGAGDETIVFDEEKAVVEVDFETNTGAFDGTEVTPIIVDLELVEDLGNPVLPNTVVVAGVSFATNTNDGALSLAPITHPVFIRGDCNDDGAVNIADAIWELDELNRGGLPNVCFEACDANDDTLYDNTDAIYILNYRFLEGPEPPAPFPDCDFIVEDPIVDCTGNENCD